MGAGKTHLLGELKTRLGSRFRYIDLDEFILADFPHQFDNLGRLIRDLGMEKFRSLESQAISKLALEPDIILALGGGGLNEKTKKTLDQSFSGIYLATDFETCFERIKNDSNRPLTELTREELARLYESRDLLFRSYPSVLKIHEALELIKL